MSSFTQPTYGSAQSSRQNRQILLPLDTSFSKRETSNPFSSSETLENEPQQQTPNTRHRNHDSLIFINATIPLSPVSSISNDSTSDALLEGLVPRKRNGFARLFCCFSREERARRRVLRATQFEKVGEKSHWSEYWGYQTLHDFVPWQPWSWATTNHRSPPWQYLHTQPGRFRTESLVKHQQLFTIEHASFGWQMPPFSLPFVFTFEGTYAIFFILVKAGISIIFTVVHSVGVGEGLRFVRHH